jgi:hypothetical protein
LLAILELDLIFAEQINTALSQKTKHQYNNVIAICRMTFLTKNKDYGQSWRIMRPGSIADQILIKATRIRNIETSGVQKINEGIEQEFIGIINYCIMGLIQLNPEYTGTEPIEEDVLLKAYDATVSNVFDLMLAKNHDYGEIWRNMLVSTFTDMILMRIKRIQQILQNGGKTLASEGIESNFMDIMNYAVFALIKLEEQRQEKTI